MVISVFWDNRFFVVVIFFFTVFSKEYETLNQEKTVIK